MRAVGERALDLLIARDRVAGSPFVFPASRGEGAYQGTKRQAGKIFAAAGIEAASSHPRFRAWLLGRDDRGPSGPCRARGDLALRPPPR